MHLPFISGHAKYVIKNYVTGELKRHACMNEYEISKFLKHKNEILFKIAQGGFKKAVQNILFSQVCYSQ